MIHVQDYTFYIHDERYSVPTMLMVTAASDRGAEMLARARLKDAPQYNLVEVWREDIRVCRLIREDAD